MYIFQDEEHYDHEYVQDKHVIERPLAPKSKRNPCVKSSTTIEISGEPSQELNDIQIDEEIATSSELNGEGVIAEQRVTIKSMESEIEKLKKKYEEAIEKLNKKENQIENLEKKYEEAVEKGNESSRKLEQIETMFFGPIDTSVDLSRDEKQALERCCEFIRLNSSFRSNQRTRMKAITMKIKSIKSIEASAQKLYRKCK